MIYEKENEDCGEQYPRNDEGYGIDLHGVVAFEYERERRKYCSQTRDHSARTVLFGFDKPPDRVRLIVLALVSQSFEQTQSQSANAMLVSKSASGVVPKLNRPNLAQYA